MRKQKRVVSITKIARASAVCKTNIRINPAVLLASFPVSNSVRRSAAHRQGTAVWFCAYTACKRPALNFIVSVRRDYFARPEDSRPILTRELGFPDQPLTRRAGSERKIEERGPSPPLSPLVCLSFYFPSPDSLPLASFCLSFPRVLLSSPLLSQRKSVSIPQLILTISRTCIYTG